MKRARILLVDNDPKIFDLLSIHMEIAGYDLCRLGYAKIDQNQIDKLQPDLILLDVLPPGKVGWEMCKRLRDELTLPIILISEMSDEIDILNGFRLGADDYLIKPFSYAELAARIGAVLRRSNQLKESNSEVKSNDLSINFEKKHVMLNGERVELSPTEYRLLEALARYAHRTIPVDRLITEVWGPEYSGENGHVKQYIWILRNKLETDPNDPKHLITRRGFGYRFD